MVKVELYNNEQFCCHVEVWVFAPWHVRALPMVALRVWICWPWLGRSWVDPLVVSRVMCPWMGPWGSPPWSGTAGRGLAQHPGLFPPSLHVFGLAVQEPLTRSIPGWIFHGSQPGRFGCAGVSSITSGLGCPVLTPIAPLTTVGLGWMFRHAVPRDKKSEIWENLRAMGERVCGTE